ncbi:MAG: glycoside hydrolase family 2 [Clostridiaceae bacterium]|nr:glycoside hydrolase family 2 [Clostridiaceae bacterium]
MDDNREPAAAEQTCVSLDGAWDLYFSPEKGGNWQSYSPDLLTRCHKIQAAVPGNVEIDLVQAGIEEDPFYGDNLYRFAQYEYFQWVYVRSFVVPSITAGERVVLSFDGIDTYADIYVNGTHVGQTDNMFIEHRFDVSDAVRQGEINQIVVHIHAAMNYARGKEYTMAMRGTAHRNEICWMRKAPHCFGWDIAPRLVSAGIWRSARLTWVKETRITETYYATPQRSQTGIWLQYGYRFVTDADTLDGFRVRISGRCKDSAFEQELPAHFISGNHAVWIDQPQLWWPAGYGDANLYDISMTLIHNGEVVDTRKERIGLRTFRLERSFEPGKQQFMLYVNDTPIFAKGTNWVPLDALHSRDKDRLHQAHQLCIEAGCNIIRCWGGNVYEDTAFFDLCDQAGIMVWQDFALGNTNYPQSSDFVPVMEKEAGSVIRKLRNHPSLVLWSGDNELDLKNMGFMYPHYDSRYNRVAHETLRRLVQAHDPYRFFLASSPEIPAGFHTDDVPEQHTWGARAWYKDDFYKHSTAHFISEAGYHGCPNPESLKRFIPENALWPYHNKTWAMHSTEDIRIESTINGRNELMANQVRILAGEEPSDLETFVQLSQMSQAEALKFFVERTRALKWDRTGIIWWNMLDCWPQISDAIVDYYFGKKQAFFYMKRVQQPVLVLLAELKDWYHDVIVSNDTRDPVLVQYSVTAAGEKQPQVTGTATVQAGQNSVVSRLRIIPGEQKLYVIRWTFAEKAGANHYITGFPPYDTAQLLEWIRRIKDLD